MLHSSHVPFLLCQEVTVGFPEEILTYPGGSGNVDGTAVGFWDILSFMNNFCKAPVVDNI